MVVCCFFRSYVNGEEFSSVGLREMLYDDQKGGYWFTISIVEVYLSFALLAYLIIWKNLGKQWYLYGFVLSVVFKLFFYVISKTHIFDEFFRETFNFLSLYKSIYYAPFFYMGVVWRVYLSKSINYLAFPTYARRRKYEWTLLACIVYIIAVSYINSEGSSKLEAISSLVFLPVAFACIFIFRDSITSKKRICRWLVYVGRRTLPIYLLHYFAIVILLRLGVFDILYGIAKIPMVNIIVILTITGVVTGFCCMADNMLKRYVPWLHSAIFSPLDCMPTKPVSSMTNV